jgi:hypothetical protein
MIQDVISIISNNLFNFRCNYSDNPLQERRIILKHTLHFFCKCSACVNDYKRVFDLPRTDRNFMVPEWSTNGSVKDMKKEIKKLRKYLEKNTEKHPNYETGTSIDRITFIIMRLAELATYPYQQVCDY